MSHSTTDHILRLQPRQGWAFLDLKDLWNYRDLLYFLTWRDIKIRYKQTLLGVTWAVLQPALTMGIFSLFFGKLAQIPSDGIPYPLFVLSALVPWNFFANGIHQASNSLVGNAHLITKVYFPRTIIPLSSVFSGIIDFFLSFLLLLGLMVFYGISPGLRLLFLPGPLLLAFLASLGVGLWLSALNVQFRDVRYTIPFLTQIWLFLTPVVYPSSLLPGPWRLLYSLNPMVGVVEGFRFALLGSPPPSLALWILSTGTTLLILAGGIFYFRRMERKFADIV